MVRLKAAARFRNGDVKWKDQYSSSVESQFLIPMKKGTIIFPSNEYVKNAK